MKSASILFNVKHLGGSPPSRGAWIEMRLILCPLIHSERSPPSRGAWIEIRLPPLSGY